MYDINENDESNKTGSSNISFGIGGTIIMVIFVVLCLTIFATLSFTTAYSDLKLSNKTSQITKDYYKVHGRAEEKLSVIYDKLLLARDEINQIRSENTSDAEKFKVAAINKLSDLEDPGLIITQYDGVGRNSDLTLSYESLGEENQKICVTLDIFYDQNKKQPYYDIVSWNLTNIELPSYGEEIYELWEGVE